MTARLNGQALPEGWIVVSLDLVAHTMYRYPTFYGMEHLDEGVPVIRGEHIRDDGSISHDWSDYWYIAPDLSQQFPKTVLEYRDIVMSVRGSVGKLGLIDEQLVGAQLSPNCIRIALRKWCDTRYLLYYLKSSSGQQAISGNVNATTIQTIKASALKKTLIPIAPLNEQHRIVDAIETQFTRLDAAVTALKRSQANLKRYRAAVLKAACEGRLVPTEAELAQTEGRSYEPASVLLDRILVERRQQWMAENPKKRYKEPVAPDTSDLPELPEGWVWVKLDQVANISGGLTKNSKRTSLSSQLPYLRVANVYADKLALDDVQVIGVRESEIDRVLLKKDDLLVVEGNGSPEQIGRVAIWDGSVEPCLHQNHLIKARFTLTNVVDYVRYWLLSVGGRDVIMKVASSTSGLYTLSLSKVSDLVVPLPPLAEQQRIVAEVERRLSLIDQLEKTVEVDLARANRLRQSILKRAFAGKLVPQDPNDEPASVLLERIQAAKNGEPVQVKLPL